MVPISRQGVVRCSLSSFAPLVCGAILFVPHALGHAQEISTVISCSPADPSAPAEVRFRVQLNGPPAGQCIANSSFFFVEWTDFMPECTNPNSPTFLVRGSCAQPCPYTTDWAVGTNATGLMTGSNYPPCTAADIQARLNFEFNDVTVEKLGCWKTAPCTVGHFCGGPIEAVDLLPPLGDPLDSCPPLNRDGNPDFAACLAQQDQNGVRGCLMKTVADYQGNEFQTWCLREPKWWILPYYSYSYRMYYVPVSGDPTGVGTCKYRYGENVATVFRTAGICFIGSSWRNVDGKGPNGDFDSDPGDGLVDWDEYSFAVSSTTVATRHCESTTGLMDPNPSCPEKAADSREGLESAPSLVHGGSAPHLPFVSSVWPDFDLLPPDVSLESLQGARMSRVERAPCDLTGDSACDAQDSSLMNALVGTCIGDAAFRSGADMTGDGCIDATDYAVLFLQDKDFDGVADLAHDNCPRVTNTDQLDTDGDGHGDLCDCSACDPLTFEGAVEASDGVDNQCVSTEAGFGLIDELPGLVRFDNANDKNEMEWSPQPLAEAYQGIRALTPTFTSGCVLLESADTWLTDSDIPSPGQVFFYLVRANAPRRGSWGGDSNGQPISPPCLLDPPLNDARYYRFEEGMVGQPANGHASILDSSDIARHGTPAGEPTYSASVASAIVLNTGSTNLVSLQFDGSQDEVRFDCDTFPLHRHEDMTLEFWLDFVADAHRSVFWTRQDGSDLNRFNLYTNADGTLGFDYRAPSGTLHPLFSGIHPEPGGWNHVAIVRVGFVYTFYVNGAVAAVATDSSPDLPTSTSWTIGGRPGYRFKGLVDEVRISRRALSPSEFLNAQPNRAGRP